MFSRLAPRRRICGTVRRQLPPGPRFPLAAPQGIFTFRYQRRGLDGMPECWIISLFFSALRLLCHSPRRLAPLCCARWRLNMCGLEQRLTRCQTCFWCQYVSLFHSLWTAGLPSPLFPRAISTSSSVFCASFVLGFSA